MWENSVVTNVGKALLASWVSGSVLNITTAKAGEGTVPVVQLMNQTALVTEKQTMSILKKSKVTGGVSLKLRLTSAGVSTAYTMNQIGVWANIDGGTPVLLAIAQDATGQRVPTATEMPSFSFTFYLTIMMNNEGSFTVTIDTSAFATQEDLESLKIFPILTPIWADHLLNDENWLRADTFSWQSGTAYSEAYQELLSEYNNASSTEETEGSITFKRTPKGYKIALATQETAILNKYNSHGIAWYYILDTANTQFKLPRTKFGFEGLRGNVGDDIAESLPAHTHTRGTMEIWGQFPIANQNGNCIGAFQSAAGFTGNGVNVTANRYVDFTASRNWTGATSNPSHATYQNNAPVQERATQMYLYFYIGKYTQTATQQTAWLNSELFNGKLDLNASNLNAQGKSLISGLGMPSGRTLSIAVGASGAGHIAPANGWVRATITSGGGGDCAVLYCNGCGYSAISSTSGQGLQVSCPVKRGSTFIFTYGSASTARTLTFIYADGEES